MVVGGRPFDIAAGRLNMYIIVNIYIENLNDLQGKNIVHIQPPTKDEKAKNEALQELWLVVC